ncbi:hypothetical protein FRC08_014845 [Ceratobasidium sp. 394]|nr:hypothetical protein FRC08_014845 [Ceratobasidium sp. 394]
MLHSLWDNGELLPGYQLYDDTTQSEVFYRLSKGFKGKRVALSQNPHLYCDFISPYKTAENFDLNLTEDEAPEPILRKKPEADMKNFQRSKRPVIHVYFDASPLIILEVTYRRRSFSLAKWDKSTSLVLLRDRVNGALYTGIDLMRLIFYSNLSEMAQQERMCAWSVSKSIATLLAEPAFYPSPLASIPRNEESSSAQRLRTMLEGLLDGAGSKSTEKLDEIYRILVTDPVVDVPSSASQLQTANRAELNTQLEQQGYTNETAANPQGDLDETISNASTEFFECMAELPDPDGTTGPHGGQRNATPGPSNEPGSNMDTVPLESAGGIITPLVEAPSTPTATSDAVPIAKPDTTPRPEQKKRWFGWLRYCPMILLTSACD